MHPLLRILFSASADHISKKVADSRFVKQAAEQVVKLSNPHTRNETMQKYIEIAKQIKEAAKKP